MSTVAQAQTPSNQTLLFYNARVALRERHPQEVLKLWLLHNTVENNLGEHGTHDADFASVVWAALGDLGLCPDGFAEDSKGAGLWPLAAHNWVLRNMSRSEAPTQSPPFDTFDVGRQQRFISLRDVLSSTELRTVSFYRTACILPNTLTFAAGEGAFGDLSNRPRAARLLRYLLRVAKSSLAANKVEGAAVLDARIFDINLALSSMAAREARREMLRQGHTAKAVGLTDAGVRDLRADQEPFAFDKDSEEAKVLRASLKWTPKEWLLLSRERRLFLFSQAQKLEPSPHQELILSMVDALTEQKQGEELAQWLAFAKADESPTARAVFYAGARGQRLLDLDNSTHFKERGVIALHRGVAFLEAGDRQEALRSFAFALKHAEASQKRAEVQGLSRRWLSYVLSRYQTNEELLATLHAIVPRQDYQAIVEDMLWQAALRGDKASFVLCDDNLKTKGALELRADKLRPLALGNLGEFATALRSGLVDEEHATSRFIKTLLDHLEAEDGDVRLAQAKTLRLVLDLVAVNAQGQRGGRARQSDAMLGRIQAMLDGLLALDNTPRGLSPSKETFAGNIRLAPTDPLPWPFVAHEQNAPSPFQPIRLVPVEWRTPAGELTFAWTITE